MKDIPNAFAFTLTVFLFWRLEKYRRWRDLLAAVVSFAFAFNVKINSAVIPLVCFTWWSITRKNGLKRIGYMPLLFFLLGPLSALALWWPFWDDPLGKLMEIPYFFSHNTVNMPVLLFGKMYRSGVNVPWYYPFAYLGITTPLVTIVAWGIGGMVIVRKILRNVSGETEKMYLLLLVWFGIPLLRYLSPKMGAIDGVRHFMEVVYPFAAIAGVGAAYIEKKSKIYLQRSTPHAGKFRRMLPSAWRLLVVLMLVYPLIYFHPYQTSYFNELIGGIRGAQGKFDIDFWATPQREAVRWINAHAPQNAIVHIVMGQSTAATYLRPDLLKNVNAKNIWESEYVVILNRESFFALYPDVPSFLKKKKEEGNVVMTREIDGVPLVWVTKK